MNALSGAHRKADHRGITRMIFTDPQVAVVGQTDEERIGSGIRCWCGTIPLEYVPRAGANHQTNGIAKVVINREKQEVLGVSLGMTNAGEVIQEAAMAMRFHAKLEDYIDLIHVYPTMAEALKIAAISYFKDPAKLSCCADKGCEVMSIPGLIFNRRTHLACFFFSPIDWLEKKITG